MPHVLRHMACVFLIFQNKQGSTNPNPNGSLMSIDYMVISVTYVQMCKTQINICLLYIALVVISHHFVLLNFHIFWINHWQGNSFLFSFEKTLNFRQFELKHSQYEVGDFVLIASSNDDFQEDPLESAYVARLEDLYSDGIVVLILQV